MARNLSTIVFKDGFETPVNTQSWQEYPDAEPGLNWHVERGSGAPDTWLQKVEFQTLSTLGLTPDEANQYAELDSDYNVIIYSMIDTNAGNTYKISFAQACRSDGGENPSTLGVYWGDTYSVTTSCSETKTWVSHSYATKSSLTVEVKLMFVDEGPSNSYGVLLDNEVVEKKKTIFPLPSSRPWPFRQG
jgi:hypothetical protein